MRSFAEELSMGDYDNAPTGTPAKSFIDARGPNAPEVNFNVDNATPLLDAEASFLQQRYGLSARDAGFYTGLIAYQHSGLSFEEAIERVLQVILDQMIGEISKSLPIASN